MVGALPSALTVGSPLRAVGWALLVLAGLVVLAAGARERASMVVLQGLTAVTWLLTVGAASGAEWAPRLLLLATAGAAGLLWWSNGRPGWLPHRVRGAAPGW